MSETKIHSLLKDVAQILEIEPPGDSEDSSWALQLNNGHTVYFSYETEKDYLYIYTPLFENIPEDPGIQLRIYQSLLEKYLNYSNSQIGTIALDPELGMILFYKRIFVSDMEPAYLLVFLPLFIETSLAWKNRVWETAQAPAPAPSPQKMRTRIGLENPPDMKL